MSQQFVCIFHSWDQERPPWPVNVTGEIVSKNCNHKIKSSVTPFICALYIVPNMCDFNQKYREFRTFIYANLFYVVSLKLISRMLKSNSGKHLVTVQKSTAINRPCKNDACFGITIFLMVMIVQVHHNESYQWHIIHITMHLYLIKICCYGNTETLYYVTLSVV